MGNGSTSSYRWEGTYPALSPEEGKQLTDKLEHAGRKIATLSETCDELGRRNYEQEQRILTLEAALKHAHQLQQSFEEIIIEQAGFNVPHIWVAQEDFSN